MIALTPDDHREIGNEIWIEDLWETEVSALFPTELRKLILELHNEWNDLRLDLQNKEKEFEKIPFGPFQKALSTSDPAPSFFSLCLSDDKGISYLLQRKKTHEQVATLWLGLSEKSLSSWPQILEGLQKLKRLLDKKNLEKTHSSLPNMVIQLPACKATNSAISVKGQPVPLGLVMAALCTYYFRDIFSEKDSLTFALSTNPKTLQYTWWTGVFLGLEKFFKNPCDKNYNYYFSCREGSPSDQSDA